MEVAVIFMFILAVLPTSYQQRMDLCQLIKKGNCVEGACPPASIAVPSSNMYCKQAGDTCCELIPSSTTPSTPPPSNGNVVTETSALSECGRVDARIPTARVVNGERFTSCSWPWLANIRLLNPSTGLTRPVCTGALVASDRVVTTAHCVKPFVDLNLPMQVVVGEYDTSTMEFEEQLIPVDRTIIHPSFDEINLGDDIAVLHLAHLVQPSGCRSPVCLPIDSASPRACRSARQSCTVASWGTLYENIPEFPLPSQANVSLLDSVICTHISEAQGEDLPTNTACVIPTGDSVKLCDGDEGGVVMSQSPDGSWVLRGLVTKPNCSPKKISFVVDVSTLSEWIMNVA